MIYRYADYLGTIQMVKKVDIPIYFSKDKLYHLYQHILQLWYFQELASQIWQMQIIYLQRNLHKITLFHAKNSTLWECQTSTLYLLYLGIHPEFLSKPQKIIIGDLQGLFPQKKKLGILFPFQEHLNNLNSFLLVYCVVIKIIFFIVLFIFDQRHHQLLLLLSQMLILRQQHQITHYLFQLLLIFKLILLMIKLSQQQKLEQNDQHNFLQKYKVDKNSSLDKFYTIFP